MSASVDLPCPDFCPGEYRKHDVAYEVERAEFIDRDPLLQPGGDWWLNPWAKLYADLAEFYATQNIPTMALTTARKLYDDALTRVVYLWREWDAGRGGGLRRVLDARAARRRAERILRKAEQAIRDHHAATEARARELREQREGRADKLAQYRRRNPEWRRR